MLRQWQPTNYPTLQPLGEKKIKGINILFAEYNFGWLRFGFLYVLRNRMYIVCLPANSDATLYIVQKYTQHQHHRMLLSITRIRRI